MLKEGTKVKVISRMKMLKLSESRSIVAGFNPMMLNYAGKVMTINAPIELYSPHKAYSLKEDSTRFIWGENLFTVLGEASSVVNKFNKGELNIIQRNGFSYAELYDFKIRSSEEGLFVISLNKSFPTKFKFATIKKKGLRLTFNDTKVNIFSNYHINSIEKVTNDINKINIICKI